MYYYPHFINGVNECQRDWIHHIAQQLNGFIMTSHISLYHTPPGVLKFLQNKMNEVIAVGEC